MLSRHNDRKNNFRQDYEYPEGRLALFAEVSFTRQARLGNWRTSLNVQGNFSILTLSRYE